MRKIALVLTVVGLILSLGCAGQEVRKEGGLVVTKVIVPPKIQNDKLFDIFVFYEGHKAGDLVFKSVFSFKFPRGYWADRPMPPVTLKNQPEKGTLIIPWRLKVWGDLAIISGETDVMGKVWLEDDSDKSNSIEVFTKIQH